MTTSRLQNESAKAYAAFMAYCEMGPDRGIRPLAQKLHKSATLIKDWSRRHNWQKRAAAWDSAQAERMRQAEDIALKEEAGKWAKRQIEHREKSFQVTQALLGVAIKELDKIRQSSRVSTLGDVSRAIQIVETLTRLNLGMATEKTELSGPDNTPLSIQSAAPVVIVIPDNGRDTAKS